MIGAVVVFFGTFIQALILEQIRRVTTLNAIIRVFLTGMAIGAAGFASARFFVKKMLAFAGQAVCGRFVTGRAVAITELADAGFHLFEVVNASAGALTLSHAFDAP